MYNLDDLMGVRGFQALTQGDPRVESMLVDNCNEYKKIRGFKKTRTHVLTHEFDYEAVEALQEVAIHNVEEDQDYIDDSTKMTGKYLAERVFRDHVPSDMVIGLLKAIIKMDFDKSVFIEKISNYMSSTPKVIDIYKRFKKFAEESQI